MIMVNIITDSIVELKRSTGFKRGSVVKEEFCKIELDGGVCWYSWFPVCPSVALMESGKEGFCGRDIKFLFGHEGDI